MRRSAFWVITVATMTLAGCATHTKYNGPGTFDDFVKARYACLQENTRTVSGIAATQGGMFGRSRNIPNCSALAACMAAKGYRQSKDGQFSNEGIEIDCD